MDNEMTTPIRENEATQAQQTTRRTFLKGTTLALPAVITLHSGAALANISVSQCVTQRANIAALPVISPIQDQLGRNLVDVYEKLKQRVTGDPNSGFIVDRGVTQPFYFAGIEYGLPVVRYISSGSIVPTTEYDEVNRPGCLNYRVVSPPQPKQYAIVYYNTDKIGGGTVVSVGSPTNPSPTHASTVSAAGACITSLMHRT